MDWNGKKVFITGNTGFKGAWLTTYLQNLGAEASGYSLPPITEPNLFGLLGSDIPTTFADVRDLHALEKAISDAQPEVIFHLAAQPIVTTSIEDPIDTITTNVVGTTNLLDAVRRTPSVRAVVIVTSDKCYENVGWAWPYRENEAMGGKDPYSVSKGCAELITAAYRSTYFKTGSTAIASGRAGNVIGGGDWSRDRLVPDIARALVAGRDPVLRFPGAVRPWQHVLDAINGYVTLAEGLLNEGQRFAEGWNFGPSEASACTVVDLAERFLRAWKSERKVVVQSLEAPNEAFTLRLDSSRARLLLKWKPRLEIDDAIAWSAEWYGELAAGTSAVDLTQRQIRAFQARSTPALN